MIIDLILDRKDGVPYDAEKFYSDIMSYESRDMSPDRSISAALDSGTNEDVQKALCNYVLWSVNGDRYVAGVDPLSLEEILKTPVCQYINSVNWLENDEELEECTNGKKLNEGYLNMTTIPTINTVADDWYLPEITDDEFNCGIDCNVAPMVGAQGGQSLSTMAGGEELPVSDNANLDYLLQMAGLNGNEVEPTPVAQPVEEPEEYKYQPVDDIFSIGFEDDFDNSVATPEMTDDEYNTLSNSVSEIPTEDEVEVPYENEIDAFDGIMDTPAEAPVEEPIAEPVPEVPVEEPVEENPEDMVLEKKENDIMNLPFDKVMELPDDDPRLEQYLKQHFVEWNAANDNEKIEALKDKVIDGIAGDVGSQDYTQLVASELNKELEQLLSKKETVESNPEDMVLEKQPEVDGTEAQQIRDYLVHNKEVLFGPASAKVEKYKKSLEGKSIEELRVEAEEVSPNWKKYIGKYKVNESVVLKKKLNESEEVLEAKYAQYKVTDLETGAVKYFDSLEALNNFLKEDQGMIADDEFLSTQEDFDNFLKRNFGGVQLKIEPVWVEIEGNGNGLTIKQNTETKEYAVFREDEVMDDTYSDDIQTCESVLEDESETDMYDDFDEDFDKLAGITSDDTDIITEEEKPCKYIISAYKWDEEEDYDPYTADDNGTDGEFYGYFARHPEDPENESFSYYVDEIKDARRFDTIDEAEKIIERFEDGSELNYHIEEVYDDPEPDGTITEDNEKLQGTKVEPTDIDLENDGVAEVHVYDIEWDCDGANPKDLALPTEVDLTIAHDGSLDIADEIADQLSDDFGFCHYGFNFKVKSLGPDFDETSEFNDYEGNVEDDVKEEVPAGQQILTEEGEELTDEDIAEIEGNETLDESAEKIEAKNVDIEPEEVKVEETTEADLKHEIPENDMIKDNIDTGKEIKVDTPVEAENGEIETKEFEVKETTEAELNHEIKDNEPIKDNIDTGEEVKVEEPVEAENVDIKPEEKADKYVESFIYSVELSDKIVECKSEDEFKKVLTENINEVKSVIII